MSPARVRFLRCWSVSYVSLWSFQYLFMGRKSIISYHLFLPGFGTKNIMETHLLRLAGSQAPECRNLGSSESMKYVKVEGAIRNAYTR
jgi:hypothetical protein